MVGPTGAGKSVLLALMALQFRRYPNSQVFAFDFGGSIRAAALAMGGDWHDLGGALSDGNENPVALQPLAWIDDPSERGWATDWIGGILAREKVEITPEVKDHLWSALTSLASAPREERTLTGLSVLLQSNSLKRALQPYCLGGPSGRLLDAEFERLGEAPVQAFETEGLIGTSAAPAVLAYLFHRIGDRLDGRPTLLIVDEGWLALDDEDFAGQLREWLKTLRKKNASVIFATQSLSDVDGSTIAPAIIESCPTRLLLPNERAIEPQITAIYRRFGLNDRQIELLSRATPKRDYYCQSRRGNRMFELGLGEVALAFAAASSKTDQAAIAQLLAEHGPDGFVPAWLQHRGVAWALDLIPNLVASVKGYVNEESTVLTNIANARAAITSAPDRASNIAANSKLDVALGPFFRLQEEYPNLKGNEQFTRLTDELAGTENRIAVERSRYNKTLEDYNVYVRQFPNSIWANMAGFHYRDEYFKGNPANSEAPKVDFSK